MATIRWFNSINGFSVGDQLTEVIDTSGNVFTSKITSYIDVDIVTNNGNKIWNFDSTGNVVFPDSTTQTTAYPGTSTTLTLTGNISVGNANLGNLTTSNYFHGVFDATSSSQPNITSVGTLGNLLVTSNISAGNVLTNNLLYANGTAWDIGGIPAGSNTQIQFNDGNEFGASANLTFNSITNTLTTANISAANGVFSGNSVNGKNALQAGVTGFTAIPNTIAQFTSNLNSASQINFQNINTGATSSTDIALTSEW